MAFRRPDHPYVATTLDGFGSDFLELFKAKTNAAARVAGAEEAALLRTDATLALRQAFEHYNEAATIRADTLGDNHPFLATYAHAVVRRNGSQLPYREFLADTAPGP